MIPHIRTVLCATDFSIYGEGPLPVAFALVADGGKVVILHVEEVDACPSPLYAHYSSEAVLTPEQREKRHAMLRERLANMVPEWAAEKNLTVETMVKNDLDPGHGIVLAAEEVDADIICVGTHGRGALAHLLTGSTATHVMHKTKRRVVAVRPRLDAREHADDA